MQKTLIIGKLDYNGNGRKNYTASVDIRLEDGEFSLCGNIYHTATKSYRSCGQILEELAKSFPNDAKLQRMVEVWREWHLNYMQAGTPAQMAYLKANPQRDYIAASKALEAAGLNPDRSYCVGQNAMGQDVFYSYGSAWLKKELPAELVAEIENW